MSSIRIGVVGDLHTHWDDVDVLQFGRSHYDLLLFTGDLGGGTPGSSLRVAQRLSELGKPALVMPGNHDTSDIDELAAELTHRGALRALAAVRRGEPGGESPAASPQVQLCGYSNHPVTRGTLAVTLVAGRPCSLGGAVLAYPEHLGPRYGIHDLEASTDRLYRLIDAAPTRDLVFLSHNGPTGFGDAPHDMWGCDFRPEGGDWGDPDLSLAIDYAKRQGRRILAVIAGHMHLRTRHGRNRPWRVQREGTLYINAARVPRIFNVAGNLHRHHIEMILSPRGASAREMLVAPATG